MARRKAKTEDEKSIPEVTDGLARETVCGMCKDGKLTPQGRSLAKLMDRIMPDEKVDEWGWNLSRKERAAIKRRAAEKKAAEEKKKAEARVCAARCRLQRFLPTNRNRRGRNGRKSCARSSAANHGFVRRSAGRLRGNKWRCRRETMLLRKSSDLMPCLSMPFSMMMKPRPSASAKS